MGWQSNILYGATLALLAAPAQAAECKVAHPSVNLRPLIQDVQINNQESQRQVQERSGLEPAIHSYRMPYALGVTLTQVVTSSRIGYQMERFADGAICATVTQVDIEFGFAPHMIYVPGEFPPGSCGYEAILAHEMQHVAVDRAMLQQQTPDLTRQLQSQIYAIANTQGDDEAQLQEQLRRRVETLLDGMQKRFTQERQQRQAQIDNPGEYDRVSGSCGGLLRQLLRDKD